MTARQLPDEEWRRRANWLLARVVVIVGAALLIVYGFSYFLLAFGGILLAVFLSALTGFVSKRTGLGRGVSLALVLVVLVAAHVAGGWWIGPRVGTQMVEMAERLPAAYERMEGWMSDRAWGRTLLRHLPSEGASGFRSNVLGRITGVFSQTLGGLTNVLIVLFLGIYLASAPALYRGGVVRLIPPRHRERAGEVLDALCAALRGWLVGRIASMAVVAGLTYAGLLVLGAPLALSLAVIAGLFSFVPYIGPIAAAVPAVMVGLAEGPNTAFSIGVLYLIVQLVESYVITPLIQQRVVSMAPALLISAQVLLGMAGGVLGVLLATPLAVTTVVLLQMLYVHDVLEEDVEVMGAGWEPEEGDD